MILYLKLHSLLSFQVCPIRLQLTQKPSTQRRFVLAFLQREMNSSYKHLCISIGLGSYPFHFSLPLLLQCPTASQFKISNYFIKEEYSAQLRILSKSVYSTYHVQCPFTAPGANLHLFMFFLGPQTAACPVINMQFVAQLSWETVRELQINQGVDF